MKNDMNDLFAAAEGIDYESVGVYEESIPYVQLKDRDLVLFAVASIEPRKEEVDALPPDLQGEASKHVAWAKGIVARLVPVAIRRWDVDENGNPVLKQMELIKGDEPASMEFPFGPVYAVFEKLSERDITTGFTRLYDANHKTLKVTNFPPGWENMPAVQRFAFWWETLSKKFGLTEKMKPGLAFWAYWEVRDLTGEKNPDGTQKYKYPFTEARKVVKDGDSQAYLEAPWESYSFPVPLIEEVLRRNEEARAARKSGGEGTPF